MANTPKPETLNAGDLLARKPSPATPTASCITGQFMKLKRNTAIDPSAEVQLLQAGEVSKVAAGTTLCVFDDLEGEVFTFKLHATEELTLTGPLAWSEMPTADVEALLLEGMYKPFKVSELNPCDVLLAAGMLGIAYLLLYLPFWVMNSKIVPTLSGGHWTSALWILFTFAVGGVILAVVSCNSKKKYQDRRYDVTSRFRSEITFTPPKMPGLKAA